MEAQYLEAIVLFSGPGGSSLGLRQAGVRRTVGVEYEANAVATATAAGLTTVHTDVREPDPVAFRAEHLGSGLAELVLQGSPPCPGFSAAGKGKGREDFERLKEALEQIAKMDMPTGLRWASWWRERLEETCADERSPLTFEVIRWIAALNPEYISLEQVPSVLVVWQEIAKVLEAWGYSTWCGVVSAEQYGVPQTRKRAILYASRVHLVEAPVPTHSKYYSRSPEKLDEGVEKWVSMAEALGWGTHDVVVSNYGSGGDPSNRGEREGWQPSATVTSKVGRNKRLVSDEAVVMTGQNSRQAGGATKRYEKSVHVPSPTVTGQTRSWRVGGVEESSIDELPEWTDEDQQAWLDENDKMAVEGDGSWTHRRPAPTIVGSFAPDVVARPSYRKAGDPPRQKTPGSVRVTVEEAGILQSFPADHPWQGAKTKQYQQVGNAVPPLLQCALTRNMLTHRATESTMAA